MKFASTVVDRSVDVCTKVVDNNVDVVLIAEQRSDEVVFKLTDKSAV